MGKGRAPCCEKVGLKKGSWTPAEDMRLMAYIQKYGHGNWRSLPKQAGLLRCGKSCRLRWINYLRPDIKRGNFTKEEENTIIELHRLLGNKWSKIASRLPGRTDNEIKNVWNTHLKKRLQQLSKDESFPSPEMPGASPGTLSSDSSTSDRPHGPSMSSTTTTPHAEKKVLDDSPPELIEIPMAPDMDIMWAMLDDSEGSSPPSPGCCSSKRNSDGAQTWGDKFHSPQGAPTLPAKEHMSSSASSSSSSTNSDNTCRSTPHKEPPTVSARQVNVIDSNDDQYSCIADQFTDTPVDLEAMELLEGDDCLLFPLGGGHECNKWIEYLEKELDLGVEQQRPDCGSADGPLPWEEVDDGLLLPDVETIDLVTTYFDNCTSA